MQGVSGTGSLRIGAAFLVSLFMLISLKFSENFDSKSALKRNIESFQLWNRNCESIYFDLNSSFKLSLCIISWCIMKHFYLDRDFLGSRWNCNSLSGFPNSDIPKPNLLDTTHGWSTKFSCDV